MYIHIFKNSIFDISLHFTLLYMSVFVHHNVYDNVNNLLKWDCCRDCRWFSSNVVNSYVIFKFPLSFILTDYSIQVSIGVPRSGYVKKICQKKKYDFTKICTLNE